MLSPFVPIYPKNAHSIAAVKLNFAVQRPILGLYVLV